MASATHKHVNMYTFVKLSATLKFITPSRRKVIRGDFEGGTNFICDQLRTARLSTS